MPQITPISRERHIAKRWRRFTSYDFAKRMAVVPLVVAEMAKAAQDLPLAFIRQRDGYMPVAVLGLLPGANLFVGPDGNWIGAYVPAALRSYPFRLAHAEPEKYVLCMEEDSGLITDGPDGMALFDGDGQLSPELRQVLEFLTRTEANRGPTATACAALDRHGLIQPLSINVETEQGERRVEGLFRIDEAALNALADDVFLDLRRAGALPLAYYQLQAMQLLPILGKLAEARASSQAPRTGSAEVGTAMAGGESFRWH